jgi:hypothetical protein
MHLIISFNITIVVIGTGECEMIARFFKCSVEKLPETVAKIIKDVKTDVQVSNFPGNVGCSVEKLKINYRVDRQLAARDPLVPTTAVY